MKEFFQKYGRGTLLSLALVTMSACSGIDANLQIFAQVQDGLTGTSENCSTTCVTNVFADPAKVDPVLGASSTSPRQCDPTQMLLDQTWMVSQFSLADANICVQLSNLNPTELLCEVKSGSTVLNTYLGVGEFPFVPQGCGVSGLEFTIFVFNLLAIEPAELATFSCDTLNLAYLDNGCTPADNSAPVCAALNGLGLACLPQ